MSLWIKICGNTSAEDALLAAEAGADAVGFVFAPSPRQVTRDQAARMISRLPDGLEKIGVFVDSTLEEIDNAVRECTLTGVQLHFDASPDLPERLRERFGPSLRILCVLHYGSAIAENAAVLALDRSDRSIDAILVDSKTANIVGGTGKAFDWNSAASLFLSSKARFVAAGGLTPANVAHAIRTLRPWGVDVVSGVEASPGHKDPEKVRQFIANARALTLA
jgi:phosphoribosylanthranilate isomerase